MIRTLLSLAACATLAACALDIAGPQTDLTGLPAGLDVQLTVQPGEVGQHAPFTARLAVTNTTSGTLRVTTAHGCLATPHVLRDGRRVPFRGSWWGCTAAITTHTFAPGQTWTQIWEMRAELYAEHPGDVDGAPAPKGSYVVRAEFDTQHKPAAEAALRVR